jgi:type VI secretion system secreted protein VgrG
MNKTQSGWKSNSSPSTYGYNEIMFEDKAGSELVRMQAEKDLHKLVKNDQETTIGRDRTTGIGHNEDVTVGNNATKSVLNSLREAVGMIRARAVGVDEVVQIGRNQTIDVGEKIEITCGKSKFVMDKDGNITLKGVRILVDGSEHVQVFGDPIDLN